MLHQQLTQAALGVYLGVVIKPLKACPQTVTSSSVLVMHTPTNQQTVVCLNCKPCGRLVEQNQLLENSMHLKQVASAGYEVPTACSISHCTDSVLMHITSYSSAIAISACLQPHCRSLQKRMWLGDAICLMNIALEVLGCSRLIYKNAPGASCCRLFFLHANFSL